MTGCCKVAERLLKGYSGRRVVSPWGPGSQGHGICLTPLDKILPPAPPARQYPLWRRSWRGERAYPRIRVISSPRNKLSENYCIFFFNRKFGLFFLNIVKLTCWCIFQKYIRNWYFGMWNCWLWLS